MTEVGAALSVALGFVTLCGIVLGWIRWGRPQWAGFVADVRRVRDTILGREAIVDSITKKEIEPALPGVGVRMAHQEERTDLIADTLTKLVDQHERLIGLTERVDGIDKRVLDLETAAVERIVGKAESAEAWRAVQAVAGHAPSGAPLLEQPDLNDD